MKRSTFLATAVSGLSVPVLAETLGGALSHEGSPHARPVKVFCTGFPKSGNHALVKSCELLGVPASVAHVPFADGKPTGTTHSIFVKRDPRNIIISMLRFQGRHVTPGTFLSKFRHFESSRLVADMAPYEGWLHDPDTHVVTFERLIEDSNELRKIAAHLGVPYIAGAFESLPGYTATWTGSLSDYREIWTPQIQNAWNSEGGRELLDRWGY